MIERLIQGAIMMVSTIGLTRLRLPLVKLAISRRYREA
jgi:hypothetical protein